MIPRSLLPSLACPILLLLSGPHLRAQDPPPEGPIAVLTGQARVDPGAWIILSSTGSVSAEPVPIVPVEGTAAVMDPMILLTPDGQGGTRPFGVAFVAPMEPGVYTFAATAVGEPMPDGRREASVAIYSVTVGARPPPPPPDPAPDDDDPPTPDPDDDDEDPTPEVRGFDRVIIAYESTSADTHRLVNVLNSVPLRIELDRLVPPGPDARPAWRMWDRDLVLAGPEAEQWADAWARIRAEVTEAPRVFVFGPDGKFTSFPLPGTVEEAVAELRKFARTAPTPQRR